MTGTELIILLILSLGAPIGLVWAGYFYWSIAGLGKVFVTLPECVRRLYGDLRASAPGKSRTEVAFVAGTALLAATTVLISEFITQAIGDRLSDPFVFYTWAFWKKYLIALASGLIATVLVRLLEHGSMMDVKGPQRPSFVVSCILNGAYERCARFTRWNTTTSEIGKWVRSDLNERIKGRVRDDAEFLRIVALALAIDDNEKK